MMAMSFWAKHEAMAMRSPRVFFWGMWALGTISQSFGILFAQVPGSDSCFLGGVLLVACGLLAGSVILGRTAWKTVPAEAEAIVPPRVMTPVEGIVTVIAAIQLCICLYWMVDLVVYALRR
jgi:hypothetical protein